ncbi:alpha-galactosidase [Paenibacillus endophyticus]|uniref:alpha-galactosidase n=1 Tax=Paenibacillus endophyticus TaxID=1294268 RepID=UPI0035E41C14
MFTLPITYLEASKIFEIRTNRSSYIFGINEKGNPQSLHWGEPVAASETADLLKGWGHSSFDASIERDMEEYGGWGGSHYSEPCLKVRFADGVRDVKLVYESYAIIHDNELVIVLADMHYALKVELRYKAIPEYDVIERSVCIRNEEASAVVVEQALAAAWSMPAMPAYRLTHVSGRWAGEFQLRSDPLTEGKKVLESRRGFTGASANPWFAIDSGKADESSGSVWFGALAWSGNWKMVVEKSSFGRARVSGGINDFDGAFTLAPGAAYRSPVFVGGFASVGFGDMSRKLHRYQNECVLPGSRIRKVLYNSWEATEFAVSVQGQKELAKRAAAIGVERFVVDDGWFGGRNSDRAGLGDWQVNPEKFPNGLQELIDEVKDLGMEFGIWVEPESVNPDSELYRKHPDWAYQFPTREGTLLRNQLLLNLGKPEVKAFVLGFMKELLGTYDISFIKWDMNRTVTEPGALPLHEQLGESVWNRHVENLYEIWVELRRSFPHVEFETCAGGGARIDLGILRYADQAWISDNTDARDRLSIQEGFTFVYSPSVMMCWVTESPHGLNGRRLPLSFRFHSAMMGGLGIGANISCWTEEEAAEASRYIALYKQIRSTVTEGSLYRLASFADGNTAAYQYVSRDGQEAVVFAFQQAQYFGYQETRLKLQGLVPGRSYEVLSENGSGVVRHGSNLMQIGIPLGLSGDYASSMVRLKLLEE